MLRILLIAPIAYKIFLKCQATETHKINFKISIIYKLLIVIMYVTFFYNLGFSILPLDYLRQTLTLQLECLNTACLISYSFLYF